MLAAYIASMQRAAANQAEVARDSVRALAEATARVEEVSRRPKGPARPFLAGVRTVFLGSGAFGVPALRRLAVHPGSSWSASSRRPADPSAAMPR